MGACVASVRCTAHTHLLPWRWADRPLLLALAAAASTDPGVEAAAAAALAALAAMNAAPAAVGAFAAAAAAANGWDLNNRVRAREHCCLEITKEEEEAERSLDWICAVFGI